MKVKQKDPYELAPWPEKRPSFITFRQERDYHYICDSKGQKILVLGRGKLEFPEYPSY